MEDSERKIREKNPRENASLLSKITFYFACGTFKKGLRKTFDESDIYEPVKSCTATMLGNRLEKEWKKQTNKKHPNLLIPLIKVFGFEFIMLGLSLLAIGTSLIMVKPLLKGKIISYFTPNQTEITQDESFYYTGALIGCSFIHTVFIQWYCFLTDQLTLKIKIAITTLIYRKCLKLNSNVASQLASGQAVTLITKDVCSFDIVLYLAQRFWVGIIEILLMTYIMYRQIGVSALVGTSALLALIPVQGQLNARFAFYLCVMTYILLGNHITAEKAFVVTGCFSTLRVVLTIYIPVASTQMGELRIALQRIVNFLNLEESGNKSLSAINEKQEPSICFENVVVEFGKSGKILENVNLKIKPGLTMITGSVGSGKSTLLKLILGDTQKTEGVVEVSGKVSYCSQEPWLFPGTVKQNIIFGQRYDATRYETVVKVCALKKDFSDLPFGDKTCLSDKGLNLSRGQKTRINLARAVYKCADIYVLDDCLSAVDPHVAKHIFHNCIRDFLKNKMCVLVTHQEQFLRHADNILFLSKRSVMVEESYDRIKDYTNKLMGENEAGFEKVTYGHDEASESTKLLGEEPGKNIYEESVEQGAVKREVYVTYFKSGGGMKMVLLVLLLSVLAQGMASWCDYFVSFWVDMEQELSGFRFNQTTNTTEFKQLEESHDSIMAQYSFVILGAAVFVLVKAFVFFVFSSRASTAIHKSMFDSILNAGMIFFDDHLSGNVINRFSRDLGIVDEQLPHVLFEITRVILMLFGILIVVSSVNAWFLIPSAVFLIILFFARYLYLPTGRSIRRLEGATRSPVIGQFNATLEGLTTIRASEAQGILKKEFDQHLDLYNSVVYMHIFTTRGFAFYLDIMCDVYVSLITLSFLFFKTDTLAGKVGLAITQAFSLSGLLQWAVRQWAEIENQMTSVERVLEYTKIDKENKSGDKINNWPSSGEIVYTNVDLHYSRSGERILKNISFVIPANEKIGVVGRTGAGKTSIISTLFRLYEYEGSIKIDDVEIKSVEVELLRSKISIIPQDPVLFTGTIRSNLDPNEQYSDRDLWSALEAVEMKVFINDLNGNVEEGGSNFSIGQRQLICLARAIVRNNLILVLDEATANIDPQTDALIQRTIKTQFKHCTVITIAHRLNTVMDSDKILVIDSGCVVEYEYPQILLANKESRFYRMASEAGLI